MFGVRDRSGIGVTAHVLSRLHDRSIDLQFNRFLAPHARRNDVDGRQHLTLFEVFKVKRFST